jgi:hypothetical protein
VRHVSQVILRFPREVHLCQRVWIASGMLGGGGGGSEGQEEVYLMKPLASASHIIPAPKKPTLGPAAEEEAIATVRWLWRCTGTRVARAASR